MRQLPGTVVRLAGEIDVPQAPPVSGIIVAGIVFGTLTFGGFGAWAALAPLTSAAMAPGIVKVDTHRKTLQHPEGGIIREILVRDGDRVSEGQVLVRLDGLEAEADRNALRGHMDALRAREARLLAQRDELGAVVFPADLLARSSVSAVAEALAGQQRILDDQHLALRAETGVWRERGEQYRAQMTALQVRISSIKSQLPSMESELAGATSLAKKGFGTKTRVNELQRQVTAAMGEIEATENQIRSLEGQIREAEVQIDALRSRSAKAVSEELREVQMRLAELEEQFRKSDARANRREILAPQDGVVMNLRFFTPGGVVPEGGAILDLVPAQDRLVLDVKINPLDIDIVRPGLPATVRLVAYKQRTTPTLEGTVSRISADVVVEERTGASYFLATVEVGADQLAQVPQVELYPGMPVDVAIVTGERTLVDYIVQPLSESFAHAFREH
jgi:HlyD family type I secretion membrane fusion protein